ncbi:MAG TPA: hypothetical protein VF196_03340 [Casimicrobiaceae bacterium]
MPGSSMLRVVALAILVGVLAPAAVPGRAAARAVPCPDRHAVTVHDLLDLAPFDVSGFGGANPRAHACFGGATITIRGFANWPDGLGGTSVSGIRPGYFEWPQFYLFASSREVAPGFGKGAFYGITVPPRFGKVENTYHRVWVVVTARFEDPLANRCRGYGPKGDRPTRAEAIATCRESLVLTSIRVASGPPDTAAAVPDQADPRTPGAPWPWLVGAVLLGALVGWRRSAGAGRRRAA